MPLNPATYRIRDSGDFIASKMIAVTFNGNGGTPATQSFNVVSGTMLGAIPATEPTRSGMFFAGWYDGSTRKAFTDTLSDDITLTANWASVPIERYTIFAASYANANVSPQGMVPVMAGDNVTFTYYADRGYTPILRIDGVVIPSTGGTYTFSNIKADHSIEIFADDSPARDATAYLTINTSGRGSVFFNIDGGDDYQLYKSPLPLYSGAQYFLKAVPGNASYFDHWSGDASGTSPEAFVTSDGAADKSVTAHFGSSSGFGIGEMAIANLICMIISLMIAFIAFTVVRKRDYDGTGTGKALRFGAVLVAIIVFVLFLLTQGFSGTYVPMDQWTIVFAILTVITAILALVSMRYDYSKE
jgi:uncharacterized repeat protein (TIGR02543 family)